MRRLVAVPQQHHDASDKRAVTVAVISLADIRLNQSGQSERRHMERREQSQRLPMDPQLAWQCIVS